MDHILTDKAEILTMIGRRFRNDICGVFKGWMPHCTKVEQVLKLAELKHVIYKLDTDYTRQEFYEKFGRDLPFQK